jgi:glutathione S-transferase
MKITVYGIRLSPFVEKTLRGIAHKGLDCDVVEPKSPGDVKKLNPQTGKMPVADLGEERVYDSTFILRRLDELVPEPALVADDPSTAAAQRQLEDWADESLYWYIMAFRFAGENAQRAVAQLMDALPIPAIARPIVGRLIGRQIGAQVRAQGAGRLPPDVLAKEFAARLDDVERMLGTRPFFYDDRLSVADLAVYGQLHFADSAVTPEAQAILRAHQGLVDHMKRVEQLTGG